LKTSLIISIILGKVIPFSLRHSDIFNQPTHSLFLSVGKTLKRETIIELKQRIDNAEKRINEINDLTKIEIDEKKKIKLDEENNELRRLIHEYKDNLNSLEKEIFDDDLIKTGLGFVALLNETSDFYTLDEQIIAKNKSIRYVIPRPKLQVLIDNIVLMDTIDLPMVIPPIE
jgi:DNA repair exonuclease SbcCD ATPase subunit